MIDLLSSLILAQADAPSLDPLTLVGAGGGTFGLVMFVVSRIDKWIDASNERKKRGNGTDAEHEAKTHSRSMLRQLTEDSAKTSEVLRDVAKTLELLLVRLEDLNRKVDRAEDWRVTSEIRRRDTGSGL